MTAVGFLLLVLLTRPLRVPAILFDLLNGFSPRPACVCAPPPCSATAAATAISASETSVVGNGGPQPYYGGGHGGPGMGGYGGVPGGYGGPGMGGYGGPGMGGYGGGPVYPGMGGYSPYYRRRAYYRRYKRAQLVKEAHAERCSSDDVGSIINQGMTTSIMESHQRIQQSLQTHYGREVLVMCSPEEIDFTVTEGAEYCSKRRENLYCYAFVF